MLWLGVHSQPPLVQSFIMKNAPFQRVWVALAGSYCAQRRPNYAKRKNAAAEQKNTPYLPVRWQIWGVLPLRIIRIRLEEKDNQVNQNSYAEKPKCAEVYDAQKDSALIKLMGAHYAEKQAQDQCFPFAFRLDVSVSFFKRDFHAPYFMQLRVPLL